jgi:hypothetical protein
MKRVNSQMDEKRVKIIDTHDQSFATGRASTGRLSIAAALKVLVEQ